VRAGLGIASLGRLHGFLLPARRQDRRLHRHPAGTRDDAGLATVLGHEVGTALPWRRAQESEADHIVLIHMPRAGYDPRAAGASWTRMQRAANKEPRELLSDHPSDERLVRQVQVWLPEAEREYRPAAT
jgi:Peptidase family M48